MIENEHSAMMDALREEMIEDQLVSRGIQSPKILDAFRAIPRHLFVDPHLETSAYEDQPLPIASGQTISQPFIVALMLEYLKLESHHSVLEIGGGSGYATALLSRLVHSVDSVEVFLELLNSAQTILGELGIRNVRFEHRSAWEQWDPQKVYDRIVLWASPPRIPEYLYGCLKLGGIMVAPEGKNDQYLWIIQNIGGQMQRFRKDSVRFVPLVQGTTKEIDFFKR